MTEPTGAAARCRFMAMRLFLSYVMVEVAVIVALSYMIGFGWTVLLLVAAFALGIALAGAQVRRQFAQLLRGLPAPGARITDNALVALGSVLMVIPGLVTSTAGLLMLLPPTRAAIRPLAGLIASRALARHSTFLTFVNLPERGRSDYIDGEVVDVHDTDRSALIHRPK